MKTQKRKQARICECSDPGCPVHTHGEYCGKPAKVKVSRYDYETLGDHFLMCYGCANDALESGVFS